MSNELKEIRIKEMTIIMININVDDNFPTSS